MITFPYYPPLTTVFYSRLFTRSIFCMMLFFSVAESLGLAQYYSGSRQIEFVKGDFPQVLERAKQEGKFVFVSTTSDRCKNCPDTSSKLFADRDVYALYNQYFINYHLNLDDSRYTNMSRVLDIGDYPTMLFIDPKGSIRHKAYIYKKEEMVGVAEDLIGVGKKTQERHVRIEQLAHDYQNITEDANALYEFARLLKDFNEPYNRAVNDYFRTQSEQDLQSERNSYIRLLR